MACGQYHSSRNGDNPRDGYRYQSVTEVHINADGKGFTSVEAILPGIDDNIYGGGAAGNSPAGTKLTLEIAISGVSSDCIAVAPITSGSDIENEEAFRQRALHAYQKPPQGGSDTDYEGWAKEVPGISRARVKRRLLGPGRSAFTLCVTATATAAFRWELTDRLPKKLIQFMRPVTSCVLQIISGMCRR